MKRILYILVCALLVAAAAVVTMACGGDSGTKTPVEVKNQGEWTIASPDGTIVTALTFDADNKIYYTVKKGDAEVVKKSELGFDIEEEDFNLIAVSGVKNKRVRGSYDNISGKSSTVEYDCNETTVTFKAWKFYLDVTVRSYDDGYAFRYGIRALDGSSGTVTVNSEKTQFALPDNTNMWVEEYVSINPKKGNFFAYEVPYDRRSAKGLNSDQYLAMPMLYRVSGTDVYSMVTESGLIGSGFYGSYLKVPEGMDGSSVLQTVHTPAGAMLDDNKIEYPFTSPWRVGITGDMKTVQESELVEKVYDDAEYWKPDDYDTLSDEEKKIYDYDWVENGIVAWSWLAYNGTRPQTDYSLHREYVDLAANMGWKYVLLDGGWNAGLRDADFKAFMDYANNAGIKVIVWCNALTDFGNGNPVILKSKLQKWASFGVAGIKIDFFDGQNANNPSHQGEDSETIKWYETIYRETAKLKMIVNCHGANKPTGERRIYPNVTNREGIMGNEFKTIDAATTVNELFTRAVVGPSDFTPVVIPYGDAITGAHQMALSVLYESGTPSMADKANTYYDSKIMDFYRAVPATRDKTVFLCGQPDYYYAAATKSGDSWFAGIVNSVVSDTVEIDLSFLGSGEYEAEIFTDTGTNGKDVAREVRTVTAASKLSFELRENGGVAIRFTKKA